MGIRRKAHTSGQFSSITKLILGTIVLVLLLYISGPPLYGGVKDFLGILPTRCGVTGKTASEYQDLISAASTEDRVPELERLYSEFRTCRFKDPLEDELHFTAGKKVYVFHSKAYRYDRAPWILREYITRNPRPRHFEEAQQLIKNAEQLFEGTPPALLAKLHSLETTNWQQAKQGYKDLLQNLLTKPREYQNAFQSEEQQALNRFIHIEADQFKGKTLIFTPAQASIDPGTGSITYPIGFTGFSHMYSLTVSTADRSVQQPTKGLRLKVTRDGDELAFSNTPFFFDGQANINTLYAVLERFSTLACSGVNPPCDYVPLTTSTSAAEGLTLLPRPPVKPVTGAITFPVPPSLPTTTDPRSAARYPIYEAVFQGTSYQMHILVGQYPTPAITVVWKDKNGNPIPEPRANAMTYASLKTLCPAYQPPLPLSRDMQGELARCLVSRQVFNTPYNIRFPLLPTPAPSLQAEAMPS